ncbi:unnamed protein product [Brugia timori]|uniref:G_PROTEIN_RECEP_F1_2 domain-containing protein n=1 Tax=Brugia timori TaxID=42155 RepID=A0A0R3RA63_9BILA|nr:unnamed protein product [Brugia timori]
MNVTEVLDNNSTTNLENTGTDLYLFILPIIVIFGLCGNVISLVTIFHSRLREANNLQISANLYLIVLTTSDSVFLLGLLLILFKLDFITYHFCVIIEYILSTSSYISSWSVAALTIERYLAIAYPLKHARVTLYLFANIFKVK